jgi:dCMP deaminase
VCHAEFNAILNKNEADVRGCTIYVTLFPCNECTKLIIEAGIAEIIYYEGPRTEEGSTTMKSAYSTSKKMMDSVRKVLPQFVYRSYAEALTGASKAPADKKFEFDDLIRPNWDQYFMSLAYVASLRSDDPKTQVGACLVNEKQRVVGIGYNAMPHDCDPKDLPWDEGVDDENDDKWIKTKYPYVIHAVQMAVLNKNTADVEGCTLYTTLFPDSDCARIIIQSGITRVVYWSEYSRPDTARFEAARMMFRKILDSDAEEAGQGQSRTINNRKFELTAYTRAFDHVKIKFTVIDNVIEVFPDK